MVLPLVLLRGSRGQRLVAIALNLGLLFMGEFLTAAMVLIFAGGIPYTSFAHEHVVVMLACRTVYLMMMVAGGLGIRAFVARWTRGERIDFVLPRFALSVLLHVCLAIGFYYILILLAIPASDPLCLQNDGADTCALQFPRSKYSGHAASDNSCLCFNIFIQRRPLS